MHTWAALAGGPESETPPDVLEPEVLRRMALARCSIMVRPSLVGPNPNPGRVCRPDFPALRL